MTISTTAKPHDEYTQRIARLASVLAQGDRRHLLISNLRLGMFGLACVLAWAALVPAWLAVSWLLVPAVGFVGLLVVHARVLNANERALRARRYYERGLSRLDGTWPGTGADGSRFVDDHPYARDLDLFGRGSLFQLLNTARTDAGETTLADWLRQPADPDEIGTRHAAIVDLRARVDFREALAVLADEARVSKTTGLASWANASPVGLGAREAVLFATGAIVNTVLIVGLFADRVPGVVVAGGLAVAGGVALYYRALVWRVIRGVDAAANDLALFEQLLRRLEAERFEAQRLMTLRTALDGRAKPSDLLARLRRLIAARDALRNEFVRPFGLLLLVRSQAAVAIDRWHQQHRESLAAWIAAVGELEALASLATYSYEHPSDPLPTVIATGPLFEGHAIAHPLLPESTAVRNDVVLGGGAARVLIVSGSNMSGKSTMLRSVGANAVLALAGGPVRAERLVLSPLAIGASIRVEDSLQEGHSRFYSEILRIRDIVSLTHGTRPVLFLLDEILHGTNSHDRRIGADAIVRTLIAAGAIGLVTTHDLALTTLADGRDEWARNVHFEDRLVDGRLEFDYRMREGVVERSNALELMRAVGIQV
jgi:hypothetical protein